MMEVIKYPPVSDWIGLCNRPLSSNNDIYDNVRDILSAVRQRGDDAVAGFSERFDGYSGPITITKEEIGAAHQLVADDLKSAIRSAASNIESFHRQQLMQYQPVETMPGVKCWQKNVPIEKVGLYIPGGTAPLFSTVLMLAIPARLAGCREIILCTPAGRDGKIHPAILFAASICGVEKIFAAGGAQAIAAMAYGTESIPQAYKIFGPGNRYVTLAKQLVQLDGIAVDMPAGPSEILVIADKSIEPSFIASDLLAQAEHGKDSQVILVSNNEAFVFSVLAFVESQIEKLPRKEIAIEALKNSRAIVLNSVDEAVEFSNLYAPEHLLLAGEAEAKVDQVRNAGSVFIGAYSPEAAGDYASGTNHTLPTSGAAKAYSGVSTNSFTKSISFQQLSKDGLRSIADTVMIMAREEGLDGHANSIKLRVT